MQNLPNTARKLAQDLFPDTSERDAFLEALANPRPYRPALIWLGDRPEPSPFRTEPPYAWQPGFVDALTADQRPGQHPLHAAGCYYCLDFSSVFAACALRTTPHGPPLAVDVCASPGGKSVFAWRALSPEQIVCNEVIGKRTAALIANLQRCKIRPAAVVSQDVSRLADAIPAAASLVVVDAPCSGQSLVARGKPSPGCFHPATINMNANRQRRILAHAARLVAPGGFLAYMTCTYARKENENNLLWMLKTHPEFHSQAVADLGGFQSRLTDVPCYRLWPQDGIGAGAFVALLQNSTPELPNRLRQDQLRVVWQSA
jgi:16S rRNA C967 or C1407 C5-methylase (RsmB/RsmF family)